MIGFTARFFCSVRNVGRRSDITTATFHVRNSNFINTKYFLYFIKTTLLAIGAKPFLPLRRAYCFALRLSVDAAGSKLNVTTKNGVSIESNRMVKFYDWINMTVKFGSSYLCLFSCYRHLLLLLLLASCYCRYPAIRENNKPLPNRFL